VVSPGRLIRLTNVARRQGGWHCHYCRESLLAAEATLDHVVPRSLGGRDVLRNLVLACACCNAAKSDALGWCSCNLCKRSVKVWTADQTRRLIPLAA
jgi:hypothetical protein